MPIDLKLELTSERLDEGAPEERATFGVFAMHTSEVSLTEGIDFYVKGSRSGPLVSGYPAAEWLAWNWWRLRWEARSKAADWAAAHIMTSIGEGYVWPNLAIWSDGVRTVLVSEPSAPPDAKPFRYFGAPPLVVPAMLWESAVDAFLTQVCGRLRDAGVEDTNLDRVWADILTERGDPDLAERRRLEAMLGRDPDAIEDDVVDRLMGEAGILGRNTVGEIAAHRGRVGEGAHAPLTVADFEALARARGYESESRDAVSLQAGAPLPRGSQVPAWRLGAAAAQALRAQEGLGLEPIDDRSLAAMAATSPAALTDRAAGGAGLSFELGERGAASRLVLRSRWHTGRRFDLARLIGDRVLAEAGPLHPATRAYTYRQKAQRAFAAELLSPFEAVDGEMAEDYDDDESREAVAERYEVSPQVIETLLVANHRLERRDRDFDMAAA